ncbi:MAG: chemotaxis protein CheW [Pseudomonadota bacterium]
MTGQLPGQEEEVQCVVIPLTQHSLLLPNVCVAEILPWRRIKPVPDAPAWLVGVLGWRGEMLPVVDFDALCSNAATQDGQARCLIVMNRSASSRGAGFYALLANGLPRLVPVAAEDLENAGDSAVSYESLTVQLGTEQVTIPDLKQIEQAVQKFGFSG